MKLLIHGAFGDLHAVEGRYHVDYRNRFFPDKACSGQTDPKEEEHPSTDAALEAVVRDMYSDKSRLWNSTGLHDLYQSHSGTRLSKRNLLTEVQKQFGNDLLVLTSPGMASIVAFRSASAHILKIVSDDEKESMQNATKAFSTQIISECKEIKTDPATYSTSINKEQAANSTSSTLQDLLAAISADLSFTLPALLIGNMITSIVTKKTTGLQLALGMLFRDSKELLSHMFDYKVTCSYDEVLTFKKSAAVEMNHGQLSQRPDMLTTHEEADTIIIQQVSQIRDGTVLVADDTDVFLLLLFFCNTGDISSTVLMASPVEGRSFLDIKASAQKYSQIIPDLLAAHALTGCDTVASPHSIGKMTALKVLKSQTCRLDQLGLIQQGQPLSAAAER